MTRKRLEEIRGYADWYTNECSNYDGDAGPFLNELLDEIERLQSEVERLEDEIEAWQYV